MSALPESYLAYHRQHGVIEGALEVEPGWFQLWPLEEVQALNVQLNTASYAPGFIGFGSDGGGEMLAFNKGGQVFMLPLVGM